MLNCPPVSLAVTTYLRVFITLMPSGSSPVGPRVTYRGLAGLLTSIMLNENPRSLLRKAYSVPSIVATSRPSGSVPRAVERLSESNPKSAICLSYVVEVSATTAPVVVQMVYPRVPPLVGAADASTLSASAASPSLAVIRRVPLVIHLMASGSRLLVSDRLVNRIVAGLASEMSASNGPTVPALQMRSQVPVARSRMPMPLFSCSVTAALALSGLTSTNSGCTSVGSTRLAVWAIAVLTGTLVTVHELGLLAEMSTMSTEPVVTVPVTPLHGAEFAQFGVPPSHSFSTAMTARCLLGATATESGPSAMRISRTTAGGLACRSITHRRSLVVSTTCAAARA